jgi:hypothetical protein
MPSPRTYTTAGAFRRALEERLSGSGSTPSKNYKVLVLKQIVFFHREESKGSHLRIVLVRVRHLDENDSACCFEERNVRLQIDLPVLYVMQHIMEESNSYVPGGQFRIIESAEHSRLSRRE